MILERLRYIGPVLIVAILSFSGLLIAKDNKYVERIRKLEALIAFDKKSIKGLIVDLEDHKSDKKSQDRISELIELKHEDLYSKISEYNELVKATSHSNKEISKTQVKKAQTVQEIEYEIGIDRDITSIHKKVQKKYKDFRTTKESKDWQKKKETYFERQKRKEKIILVE